MKAVNRLIVMLPLSILSLVGCEIAPGVHQVMGNYERVITAPPAEVDKASAAAVVQMGLYIVEQKPGRVVAHNGFGTKLTVVTMPGPGDATRVWVHVDPGNSEGLSMETFRRIQENL